MADEADLAYDSEQRHLAQALAAQRARHVGMRAMGACHNCGNEEGLEARLFCDSDCAADYEYQATVRRKLGLPAEPTVFH